MIARPDWPAFRKCYFLLADDFRDAWRTYSLVWSLRKYRTCCNPLILCRKAISCLTKKAA